MYTRLGNPVGAAEVERTGDRPHHAAEGPMTAARRAPRRGDGARRRRSCAGVRGPVVDRGATCRRSRPTGRPGPRRAGPRGRRAGRAHAAQPAGRRSARSSACCAPVRAWSRSTRCSAPSGCAPTCPSLGLPLLVGESDDLALRASVGPAFDGARRAGPPRRTDRARRRQPCPGRRTAPAPGVAVRMLTSGTTGPPKRIDLALRDARAGDAGGEALRDGNGHRSPAPHRRRDRQRAARPRERGVPRVAGHARRTTHRAARALHRRRLGRGGAANTNPRPSASCRPRCAWCSTPTSTRGVRQHPLGGIGHRAARPRSRRRVHARATASPC